MRRYTLFLVIIAFAIAGCDPSQFLPDDGSSEELPVERISLLGVDRLSSGGTFKVVVQTQEEYEQLIEEFYQEPLNEYCNESYPDERERLEHENPDLSEEEIQARLNEICIERTPIFEGLDDVEHPEINFSEHSLLGQDAHASGCSTPDYDTQLTRVDGTYRYYVKVTQYGLCQMAISKNLWLVTPKIPEGSEVSFEKEYEQQSRKE